MIRYEYHYASVRRAELAKTLNDLGQDGWGIAASHFVEVGDVVHLILFRPKKDT